MSYIKKVKNGEYKTIVQSIEFTKLTCFNEATLVFRLLSSTQMEDHPYGMCKG